MECFFCQKKKPPLIKSSRSSGFREASRLRYDGLSEKLEEGADFILCHKNCVSSYCSKDHLQCLSRKRKTEELSVEEPKRLRGSSSTFNFREHCLFCGETCSLETPQKHPDRWKKAYLCRTGDEKGRKTTKGEIQKRAKERGDNWGTDVSFRVSSAVSDLHAADAIGTTETVIPGSTQTIHRSQLAHLPHRTIASECWLTRCYQTKHACGIAWNSMNAILNLEGKTNGDVAS